VNREKTKPPIPSHAVDKILSVAAQTRIRSACSGASSNCLWLSLAWPQFSFDLQLGLFQQTLSSHAPALLQLQSLLLPVRLA
jgi:hypothetical protein